MVEKHDKTTVERSWFQICQRLTHPLASDCAKKTIFEKLFAAVS
jgi:hypothetical protein